jgi:hypothetical protein
MDRLPEWMKKTFGLRRIEQNTIKSIGAALRKQFNGELLAKTLQRALPKLAQKTYVKKTEKEKKEAREKAYIRLEELEKKVAEKGIAFVFRVIGAHLEHKSDFFTHPLLKGIHDAIIAVFAFVMLRLVAPTLRLAKIEQFVIHRLHAFVKSMREKFISVFSRPDLHENFAFSEVEAFEKVVANQTLQKTTLPLAQPSNA